METIFLVLFKTEEVHIWAWAIFSQSSDIAMYSGEKREYVSTEIMQGIHKNMGAPMTHMPGYNPVSTWADVSLPKRPLYRLTSTVPTIFHTSLYLSTFGSTLPY